MAQILLIVLLLAHGLACAAAELTAVSPSSGYPGTVVTLAGGPFAEGSVVIVGDQRLAANRLSSARLSFVVPGVPPGDYLLAVEAAGERSPSSFVLHIMQPPPRIERLDPATLDLCAANAQRVTVGGSHFQAGAVLLFDGAAIASEQQGEGGLTFVLPGVKAGLHQVQLVNPDGQKSFPRAFSVNGAPVVDDVQFGDDRIVEYELVLRGRNFAAGARVVLNGAPAERDSLRQDDCMTLVYVRRPLVRAARELSLQVVNGDGERSNLYRITAP